MFGTVYGLRTHIHINSGMPQPTGMKSAAPRVLSYSFAIYLRLRALFRQEVKPDLRY
jgi:hypothetical protein